MPAEIMAAVLENVTCYVQTGSVKAARRAVLLLERLSLDRDVDERVRERGGELAESIEAALNS
jgi:hypothetical protein